MGARGLWGDQAMSVSIPSWDAAAKSIAKGDRFTPCSRTFYGPLAGNKISSRLLWVKDSKSGGERIRFQKRRGADWPGEVEDWEAEKGS